VVPGLVSNRSIAIIEDDYTTKSQLKVRLEKAGYKVSSFTTSSKLIAQLAAMVPEIVIMDKDPANPKKPFWIIELIKKEPKLKKTEIFAYLKEIEVKDEIALRRYKVTSYFTKTNKINYIIEGVKKHFALQGRPEEFDPWIDFLEMQQQIQHKYEGPPGAPGQLRVPPGAKVIPPPGAQRTNAPAPKQPLIPSPPSAAPHRLPPTEESSDFLTTIQDKVVAKDLEKKAASPALENFNKGVSFYNKEQYPQALIMFEKSRLDKMLQAKSLVMIGKIHRHMNNMNAAIATFKEAHHAAEDTETKLESRYQIAETMKKQGKLQDAYNMFATVYKADKEFKDTRNKLIELKKSL